MDVSCSIEISYIFFKSAKRHVKPIKGELNRVQWHAHGERVRPIFHKACYTRDYNNAIRELLNV